MPTRPTILQHNTPQETYHTVDFQSPATSRTVMEATPEQTAEGAAIVVVLADVLERLVISNAGLARQDPGQVTKFHALKAPGIAILPYLERWVCRCQVLLLLWTGSDS